MKPRWIVAIVRFPKQHSFRVEYFPRLFYYKRDALALASEVIRMGGEATVTKEA